MPILIAHLVALVVVAVIGVSGVSGVVVVALVDAPEAGPMVIPCPPSRSMMRPPSPRSRRGQRHLLNSIIPRARSFSLLECGLVPGVLSSRNASLIPSKKTTQLCSIHIVCYLLLVNTPSRILLICTQSLIWLTYPLIFLYRLNPFGHEFLASVIVVVHRFSPSSTND